MRFAGLVCTLAAVAAAAPVASGTGASAAVHQDGKRQDLDVSDVIVTLEGDILALEEIVETTLERKRHTMATEKTGSKGKRELVNLSGALQGTAGVVESIKISPLANAIAGEARKRGTAQIEQVESNNKRGLIAGAGITVSLGASGGATDDLARKRHEVKLANKRGVLGDVCAQIEDDLDDPEASEQEIENLLLEAVEEGCELDL